MFFAPNKKKKNGLNGEEKRFPSRSSMKKRIIIINMESEAESLEIWRQKISFKMADEIGGNVWKCYFKKPVLTGKAGKANEPSRANDFVCWI